MQSLRWEGEPPRELPGIRIVSVAYGRKRSRDLPSNGGVLVKARRYLAGSTVPSKAPE
jgi:hypothetical protein